MSITGAPPDVMLGGSYASGPSGGDYHVVVTDSTIQPAKTTGRPMFILQLNVKDDPNHPAKEGKKLTQLRQSLPWEKDTAESKAQMKGMAKRMLYDGFGVPWPKEDKKVDPRIFIGKSAWVRLAKKNEDDQFTNVVAVAPTADKLPAQRGATPTNGKAEAKSRR